MTKELQDVKSELRSLRELRINISMLYHDYPQELDDLGVSKKEACKDLDALRDAILELMNRQVELEG